MPDQQPSNNGPSVAGDGDDNSTSRSETYIPNGESGAKRRRIALACTACRIRKSRCNGNRPRCDPCDRMGFECSYETPETAVNLIIRKDLFATLEERVGALEETISQHETRLAATENARRTDVAAIDRWPDSVDKPLSVMTSDTAISVRLQDNQEQNNDTGTTDGMAIALVDEDECGFFGPSSNISFMRHIFAALSRKSGIQESPSSPSRATPALHDQGLLIAAKPGLVNSVAEPPAERAAGLDANILPPDYEVEALLLAYFSNTGLLFPYVHEPTFMETYRELKSQGFSTSVRRTWLGLLNMILAMAKSTASQHSVSSPSRGPNSDVFYRRAQKLCANQMHRGTTLETVQYLLITTQYLQGTQNSLRTWTIHGLAVKAAFSIGLHSSDILKRCTPLEQEIRKRTWHGCILLDRSLSMTFGRPCSIPQEYIQVDLPTPTGDPRGDLSIAFYNATIRLYEILWRVIKNLYGHNLGSEKAASHTSVVTHILQISNELDEWKSSLPSSLALVSADGLEAMTEASADPIRLRYRVILTLRHLNTHVLLHRLALTRTLDNARSTAPGYSRDPTNLMEQTFNLSCIRSAEHIISIVHSILTGQHLGRDLVGAWWFTLYYTFNAALAVFGGLLSPQDDEPAAGPCPTRLARGRQFLQYAIEALLLLDQGNAVIERYSSYLRYLTRLVDGWIPAPSTDRGNASSASHVIDHALGVLYGRGARNLQGHAMPGMVNDGLDDLELGPLFMNDMQQWFEIPSWNV